MNVEVAFIEAGDTLWRYAACCNTHQLGMAFKIVLHVINITIRRDDWIFGVVALVCQLRAFTYPRCSDTLNLWLELFAQVSAKFSPKLVHVFAQNPTARSGYAKWDDIAAVRSHPLT